MVVKKETATIEDGQVHTDENSSETQESEFWIVESDSKTDFAQ